MADRAGAGKLQSCRHPRSCTALGRLRDQDTLGARHHRHALVRPGRSRHRRTGGEQRGADSRRADRLQCARSVEDEPQRRRRRGRNCAITPPISAMRCCSSAMSTIRARPTTPPSPRPPPAPFPTSSRCSGASASWWGSASISSPSLRLLFWDASHRNFSRTMAVAARAVVAAAALGRGRTRLGRRRIRPPALGDRRRAADVSRLVVGLGRAGAVHACAALSCSIRRCSSSTSC